MENKDDILNYRAGIYELASSLHILSTWKCFLPGDAGTIATAVFGLASGSTFKDQKPITRIKLYEVIDFLFKKYQTPLIRDVKATPLVSGLVSMAELEKNPSCLSILFPLYAHISKHWTLGDSDYDSIWESFIRYFPITLGGAPQDPSVPAKELIKELLLQCIISSHHYAKGAVPRFIDMLDTNTDVSANLKVRANQNESMARSHSQQIEVLSTLAACITSYPVPTITLWSSKIWDALKFEIWNGENEDFIQGSLDVLRAIAASLGKGNYTWSSQTTPMTEFVVTAAKECLNRVHDSRKLYLVSSGRILHAMASGAPYAFHLVAKTVLPSMHVIWQDLKLPSEKKMLLTVYNYILDARLVQPKNDPQRDLLVKSFEGFRDGIVEIYFGAVSNMKQESSSSDVSFGVPAVDGLVLLFQIPSYISAVEQGMIVQELNTILFAAQDSEIRNAVLLSLQKISAMEPDTFHEITLTNFVEKLPDIVSRTHDEGMAKLDTIVGLLQDLVEIACSQPCQRELRNGTAINTASSCWHRNFDALENKLLEKLDAVLQKSGQLEYANTILAAICGGLQLFDTSLNQARTRVSEPKPLDPKIGPYSYIIKVLFQKVVRERESSSGPYIGIKDSVDEKFVQIVGRTAMWALRSELTTAANSVLLNRKAISPDEPSVIWTLLSPGPCPATLSTSQQNLENGPADKCLANVLSVYLLAGHRPGEPLAVSS